jgi:FtsZ-binding cell division protein ZapB
LAYEFLGTFNRSQWERWLAYARSQLPLVEPRRQHVQSEIARVGSVIFRIDKGVPRGYAGDPETSYLGKLLRAYEVLGGSPMLDLRVRLQTDPVFILKGDELTFAQMTSAGEPIGSKGLEDGPTAVLVQRGKRWLNDTTKARFNYLERKIRRAVDYSDQLQVELQELSVMQMAAETQGSLEYIAAQVQQYITKTNYRATYDDQAQGKADPLGLLAHAPFGSYDARPSQNQDVDRTVTTVQRQAGGVVEPGEKGGPVA